MTQVFRFIFVAILFATCGLLQKALGEVFPETPIYLYHWISSRAFIELSAYEDAFGIDTRPRRISFPTPSGDAPFFKDIGEYGGQAHRSTLIASNFPELKGRNGIFTTTNPVTGSVGSIDYERYGDVLVRFKLNQRLIRRANLEPKSIYGDQGEPLSEVAKKANLLFHAGAREWIILDPSIIESFSADPEVLRADLEAHLRKLKLSKEDPNYEYSDRDLHGLNFNEIPADPNGYFNKVTPNLRNYAIYAISKFLKYGRILIPEYGAGQVDGRTPWPNSAKRQKLEGQLEAEEEAIRKHESFLDSRVVVRESDRFDHILLKDIVASFEFDLEKQFKRELKIKEFKDLHPKKWLFLELSTAVFGPVMNAHEDRTRFSGRYFEWSWKGNETERREPYEKLTPQEVLEINRCLTEVRNGNLSTSEIIQKIAQLFQAEDVIYKRVKRVLKKHKSKNIFRIEPEKIRSCRKIFKK